MNPSPPPATSVSVLTLATPCISVYVVIPTHPEHAGLYLELSSLAACASATSTP